MVELIEAESLHSRPWKGERRKWGVERRRPRYAARRLPCRRASRAQWCCGWSSRPLNRGSSSLTLRSLDASLPRAPGCCADRSSCTGWWKRDESLNKHTASNSTYKSVFLHSMDESGSQREVLKLNAVAQPPLRLTQRLECGHSQSLKSSSNPLSTIRLRFVNNRCISNTDCPLRSGNLVKRNHRPHVSHVNAKGAQERWNCTRWLTSRISETSSVK